MNVYTKKYYYNKLVNIIIEVDKQIMKLDKDKEKEEDAIKKNELDNKIRAYETLLKQLEELEV